VTVEHISAERLREAVSARIADGARFAGAWAITHPDGPAWRIALATPRGHQILATRAGDGVVPTIVDLVPAAAWDEREAHDTHGLAFDGHEPLRSLVAHPAELAAWTTPVHGDGVHQVAVGPIHAGVIESGHFRFHVVGERILAMDPRLFYKHRGLERAAEGASVDAALAFVQRACAACAVTNTVAYAQAVEQTRGLWPDRHLRSERTLLLELERLYNHLNDIGAVCAGVGFAPGAMAFAALKDRAQQLNERVAGHRFLFGAVAVGRGVVALGATTAAATRSELRDLRTDSAAAWRELDFTGSVQARLRGVGILDEAGAERLGAVGPAARAAGLHTDARATSPRLAYEDFMPAAPREPTGDVAARLDIRAAELEATYELLDDLLAAPVTPGGTTRIAEPSAVATSIVESPRGATLAAVELQPGRLDRAARVHLRTGSYANWPALAHATAGNLLPDFPLINKSFELCYACVDR
jgi:Ni,Fe-hydrogenase III large subunit